MHAASGQCGVEGLGEMRFCLFASWMQFEVVKLAADCIRGQQPRCPVYLQCCLHCIAIAPASVSCAFASLSLSSHTHAAKSVGFVTPAFLSSDAFELRAFVVT
jgi:hypothetical protein